MEFKCDGGPFDGETLYLQTGITLHFKVGIYSGHYVSGYWWESE